MIAIAEVKGVLPEADPHHDADDARREPRRAAATPTEACHRRGRVDERSPHEAPALILAEFDTPGECLHAAEALRDAGYKDFDTHTPFPIHGMDAAMGLGDSQARLDRLPDRPHRARRSRSR